jgi:hypothetical protein
MGEIEADIGMAIAGIMSGGGSSAIKILNKLKIPYKKISAPNSVPGNACFVAGTLVATENGYLSIEDIKQGVKVWSFNHDSEEWELNEVVELLIHNYDERIYSIAVDGETIEATHNHPFWVVEGDNLNIRSKADDVPIEEQERLRGGHWVAAEELQTGDLLKLKDGRFLRIEGTTSRPTSSTLVYNITVEGCHNYAVGRIGVLVHNKARRSLDPTRPAEEVLPGSLQREFPGEHLGKSLNDIKDALEGATGAEKKALQKAKKLLEQYERLLKK